MEAIETIGAPPRRPGLRHRRRRRPPARAGRVRGRRLQQRRAARRDRLQVPAGGEADQAARRSSGRSARSAACRRGRASQPVFVGGVTVENITLHNPRLIRERDLRIGDTVAVVRRGDVIPFAGRSIPEDRDGSEQEIVPPTHCPSCGSELEVRGTGEERWCVNLQCPAQATRRLMHWASRHAADMEGVGDVWIEKLADDGVLRRRSDFYSLTAEQLLGYDRMGDVSARNMVDSIAPLQGAGAAPRADRAGDPDGLRGHRQAPVPGRLRADRGRRGRDRRGTGSDPRHRPQGRRERRRVLRAARRCARRSRRCATTASCSTCSTRTARSTPPPRATRRSRARRS